MKFSLTNDLTVEHYTGEQFSFDQFPYFLPVPRSYSSKAEQSKCENSSKNKWLFHQVSQLNYSVCFGSSPLMRNAAENGVRKQIVHLANGQSWLAVFAMLK